LLIRSASLRVDVERGTIAIPSSAGSLPREIAFTLDPLRKEYLAGGFLPFVERHIPLVGEWEAAHVSDRPARALLNRP